GRRHDVRARLRFDVEHLDRSLVTAAQHIPHIVRIERKKRTLATRRRHPAPRRNPAAAELTTRYRHRRVVLLSAVNSIRKLVVDIYAIKLRGRHVALRRKHLSGVESDRGAAIV